MSKTVFIDQVGRTIIGEHVDRTDSQLVVKNPAMINVAQMQNGQLQVQVFPLYFSEFIAESQRNAGTTWRFNLAQIALSDDIAVDNRIVEQYDRVCGKAAPTPPAGESVIKLFDE